MTHDVESPSAGIEGPAPLPASPPRRTALEWLVGLAALVAPVLHSLTDAIEWRQGGFSPAQLWLNYVAFLPMPWLLLGVAAIRAPRASAVAIAGAALYGVAFVYFAHTTLYALAERVGDYASLWERLGAAYTVHGALMVAGGLMFGASALRGGWLPTYAVVPFLGGVALNLMLALLPAPDLLQVIGSALRNAGLAAMGVAILARTGDGR